MRAVRVGNATTTARIAAFITSALDRKPKIQSKAERLADQRILLTLGLGAVTFLFTRDLTRATADVVLLRDKLAGIVESRALAGETIRLIQSNFRWAVVLNTLLFIAAMAGRASPVFSTVAHNGVTIATLVRALVGPQHSTLPSTD